MGNTDNTVFFKSPNVKLNCSSAGHASKQAESKIRGSISSEGGFPFCCCMQVVVWRRGKYVVRKL